MCHASSQEKGAFKNQLATTSAINSHLDTIFSNNENILGNLKQQMAPIITAGANQYAFNASKDAALRGSGAAAIAAAGRNAAGVARSAAISSGAGTSGIPAGSQSAIDAGLADEVAQKQAQYSNDVTAEGYKEGTENFFKAGQILPGAANTLENQTNNAGALANQSAGAQSQAAQAITAANNAWVGPVAGLLGSTANAALSKKWGGADPSYSYADKGGPGGFGTNWMPAPDPASYKDLGVPS